MSGYPLLEVGTPPPYNEQVIWARWPELKTKDKDIDGYAKKYRRDSLICITSFLEKSKKITVYRYIISPGLSRNLSCVLEYSCKSNIPYEMMKLSNKLNQNFEGIWIIHSFSNVVKFEYFIEMLIDSSQR